MKTIIKMNVEFKNIERFYEMTRDIMSKLLEVNKIIEEMNQLDLEVEIKKENSK